MSKFFQKLENSGHKLFNKIENGVHPIFRKIENSIPVLNKIGDVGTELGAGLSTVAPEFGVPLIGASQALKQGTNYLEKASKIKKQISPQFI